MKKPLPLLSICIPTYNRCDFLRQTIDSLKNQIRDDVEIIVFDNFSTDETQSYLKSISSFTATFRQNFNIGLDGNVASCLVEAQGQYVWILSDDDLPCSDTVDTIISGIKNYDLPPFLFLKEKISDSQLSDYNNTPCGGGWNSFEKNEFLKEVGVWCTFVSSIVVRRDCLNINFIKSRIGTFLVPAAITLSTVGSHNSAYVSEKPLIFVRSENSGGYKALTIFTKELSILLKLSKQFGYSKNSLDYVYKDSLNQVLPSIFASNWGVDSKGFFNLFRYSYRYKTFYGTMIRAIRRKITKN